MENKPKKDHPLSTYPQRGLLCPLQSYVHLVQGCLRAKGVFILFVTLLLTSPANASVLSVARSQIGKGEIGGNNRGPVVHQYTQGQNVPWCAGFVSWTLKQSGKKAPYLLRAKSYLKYGKRVLMPKPGDLVVFNRKGGGHVGIVESVNGKKITTIEGNVGSFPAKVKRFHYTRGKIKNFVAFVRL
jgi:uncharacterized protein (TIGR02594 family)